MSGRSGDGPPVFHLTAEEFRQTLWVMAAADEIHFLINAGGKPRRLLTAHEGASGLILRLPQASKMHAIADYEEDSFATPALKTVECRFSVHPTTKSPFINEIKYTSRREEQPDTRVLRTNAIKVWDEFAPVFFRTAPDLSLDRYLFTKTRYRETVSLGDYDPSASQLRYMVLVSRPETRLLAQAGHINATDFEFGGFRLTVLWNFLCLPSYCEGEILVKGMEIIGIADLCKVRLNSYPRPHVSALYGTLERESTDEFVARRRQECPQVATLPKLHSFVGSREGVISTMRLAMATNS